jgi:hypothetical protein
MSFATGDTTDLTISGPGIAPFSARGLTQTLDHIDAASVLARSVNGDLLDFSPPQMRKFKSTITCEDVDGPALDDVWPGDVLTVDCAAELGFKTGVGSATRPIVPDSSRASGGYTYYRPQLIMMVISYTTSRDEYGRLVSWTLDLEEV